MTRRFRVILACLLVARVARLDAQVVNPDGTFQVIEAVPGAPTAALVATSIGNCTNGSHVFAMTRVTTHGETTASPLSNAVTCDGTHKQVTITFATPLGSPAVIGRNVWASAADTTTPLLRVAFSPVVTDLTATTYTFNTADAALQPVSPPASNTAIDTKFTVDGSTGHVVSPLGFDSPSAGAIGNLNGFYGYSSAIYGAAFGAAAGANVTMDATNGFRVRTGTSNKFQADASGNLFLTGDLSLGTSGAFRSGATAYGTGTGFWMDYNAGTPRFRIGTTAGDRFAWDGTNLTVKSANFTVDSTGAYLTPNSSATIAFGNAFGFTVPTGLLAWGAWNIPGSSRALSARSTWTGAGDLTTLAELYASGDSANTHPAWAQFVSVGAGSTSSVTLHGQSVAIAGEAPSTTYGGIDGHWYAANLGGLEPTVQLYSATRDAATAAVTDIFQVEHRSTGTPAATFGAGILLSGQSSTTTGRDMARVQAIWTTATDATRASALQFQTLTAAGSLTTQQTIAGDGGIYLGAATGSSKGAGTINVPTTDGYYVNGTKLVDLTHTWSVKQTFSIAPMVPGSTGTAVFAADCTDTATITIANNGTATPFSNSNNFSGQVLITEQTATGQVADLLIGAGVNLRQTGTVFTTTVTNAGTINLYQNAGVFTIENKTGGSRDVRVCAIRIRTSG